MQSNINDPTYHHFIAKIVQQGHLFTLTDEDDFYAECPSEVYENNLGESIMVNCFWDDQTDALNCMTDEWEDYLLEKIDLADFINDVLPECYKEKHLLGIAFDEQLYGLEAEPIDVLGDTLTLILKLNQDKHYERFPIWLEQWQAWQNEQQQQRIIH